MSMEKLNDANFEELMLNAGKLAVVDFGAVWCNPCKKIEPILNELSAEMSDKAVFGKVDIDSYPAIAQSYNVMSVPTVIFLKDGKEADRIVGLAKKAKLVKKIESLVG